MGFFSRLFKKASKGLDIKIKQDNNGTKYAAVCGIGTCKDERIIIPDKFEGVEVSTLESLAFYKTNVKEITFNKYIKNAFNAEMDNVNFNAVIHVPKNNPYFEEINGVVYEKAGRIFFIPKQFEGTLKLPEYIKRVYSSQFRSTNAMTGLVLGPNIEEFEGCFIGNTSIKHIELDPSNPNFEMVDGVIYTKDHHTIVFVSRELEGEFVVPEEVTRLGEGAFSGSRLSKVTIPVSVEEIGYDCFDGSYIQELVFLEGSTVVQPEDLGELNGLRRVVIPGDTELDEMQGFFIAAPKLEEIELIGECSKLALDSYGALYSKDYSILYRYPPMQENYRYDVHPNTKTIGYCALRDAKLVDLLHLSSKLETIGMEAFRNMERISIVVLPSGIDTIDNGVFLDCSGLRQINFTPNMTAVGRNAFKGTQLHQVNCNTTPQKFKSIWVDSGNEPFLNAKLNIFVFDDEKAFTGYKYVEKGQKY